jgi:DNA-binding response OmpR family regulator
MGKPSILIVDDESNIRMSVRMSLESEGYSIREASNGSEALEQIAHESPALVLLDLSMPVMDGMTVLAEIKNMLTHRATPVVVLTAHGGVSECVKAMRLGAADFLEKPMTPDMVRKSVAAAIRDSEKKPPAATPAPPLLNRSPLRNVNYSQTLVHIQHAIWNSDIHRTEQTLAECFRRASGDPAYYNVLGVAFEAEGNREAARTFYQKAAANGCSAAHENLHRLEELDSAGASQIDVALGEHAQFMEKLCTQTQKLPLESNEETDQPTATQRS